MMGGEGKGRGRERKVKRKKKNKNTFQTNNKQMTSSKIDGQLQKKRYDNIMIRIAKKFGQDRRL